MIMHRVMEQFVAARNIVRDVQNMVGWARRGDD
jgi:hypothetical protein